MSKKEYVPAKRHISLTTGETIIMLRELKGWTQEELSKRSNINSKNISMLENDHLDIGKKRAIQLANAFGIHPTIIMFPEFEADLISQVA